ncbi:IS5 family transposase [Egbenema bharatensis]|uniref:IS5 family transposase n=1 Tax=Egbenema bharatensis TaxID=3463334 RepID=UPI003A872E14
MSQTGVWEWEKRQSKLNQKKDLLMRLDQIIPWQEFRPTLEKIHNKPRKSNAGRKAMDVVVMFKLLVLQQLYNISDEELEYQVSDRLSFMQFMGFGLADEVPDATTVWLFRKQLSEQGLIEAVFEQFDGYLVEQGYAAKGGQIVDATLIPVPKQHNSDKENEQIKQGKTPQQWQDQPHRRAQKDTDARWTKKGDKSYFGYKDHIGIDAAYGLIRRYAVTDASVHDSQVLGALLDEDNQSDEIWADSAYRSAAIEETLELMGFESQIHERAYRNRPLSEAQKQSNRDKSKTRARVEHVFGRWTMQMGGKLIRSIGLVRAKATLGLKNLTYNFVRYTFLQTQCPC